MTSDLRQAFDGILQNLVIGMFNIVIFDLHNTLCFQLLSDLAVTYLFFRFQCLPSFLTQCQQKGLLDGGKLDQIMSQRSQNTALFDATAPSDRNPVGSVLNAGMTKITL